MTADRERAKRLMQVAMRAAFTASPRTDGWTDADTDRQSAEAKRQSDRRNICSRSAFPEAQGGLTLVWFALLYIGSTNVSKSCTGLTIRSGTIFLLTLFQSCAPTEDRICPFCPLPVQPGLARKIIN